MTDVDKEFVSMAIQCIGRCATVMPSVAGGRDISDDSYCDDSDDDDSDDSYGDSDDSQPSVAGVRIIRECTNYV